MVRSFAVGAEVERAEESPRDGAAVSVDRGAYKSPYEKGARDRRENRASAGCGRQVSSRTEPLHPQLIAERRRPNPSGHWDFRSKLRETASSRKRNYQVRT